MDFKGLPLVGFKGRGPLGSYLRPNSAPPWTSFKCDSLRQPAPTPLTRWCGLGMSPLFVMPSVRARRLHARRLGDLNKVVS